MLNKLEVIGNLTKDAEVKSAESKKVINFSIATNNVYKDQSGQKVEEKIYYNCSVWRDSNVNVAQYLTKGTLIWVEGTPKPEVYKTKSGEIKASIKINVNNFYLLASGNKKVESTNFNVESTSFNQKSDLPF